MVAELIRALFQVNLLDVLALYIPYSSNSPMPLFKRSLSQVLEPNGVTECSPEGLDSQALNLVAHGPDGAGQLAAVVGGDASSNHGAGDTASPSESHLAGHEDVWGALVLAEESQVQDDGDGGRIGGKDGDFTDTTVESLGD